MCLVYLAPRDQRHFLVLRPNWWRGKIEMAATSWEGGGGAGLWPFLTFSSVKPVFPWKHSHLCPKETLLESGKNRKEYVCVLILFIMSTCVQVNIFALVNYLVIP